GGPGARGRKPMERGAASQAAGAEDRAAGPRSGARHRRVDEQRPPPVSAPAAARDEIQTRSTAMERKSSLPPIVLNDKDYAALSSLLGSVGGREGSVAGYLSDELARANVVDEISPDVVAMHSEVEF